ncbi:MAG: ribose 5-phosphate isomerase B [Thermoanaerobaculales bacterium]|jgi:ribose 5-phosphate isomerase B|nr:ribose 5-phosphate isomerase B [Thermoanaerobaculales bacterium]
MIAIASDHAGITLKTEIVRLLQGLDLEVEDLGPGEAVSVDYPDYAHLLAAAVADGRIERGVLICGTGLGMSMAANRHPGVRAALCHDAYTAEMARRHNDANVLCMGARAIGPGVAEQVVKVFVETPFDGDRHLRRVAKIEWEES